MNDLNCKKNRKRYKEHPARLFSFVAKQRKKNAEWNKGNNVSKQIEIGILHHNVVSSMQDNPYLIADCCKRDYVDIFQNDLPVRHST